MNEQKYKILDVWPQLQEDFDSFLKNPYKWLERVLEQEIIPPESEGVERMRHIQQGNLRKLLSIFKIVNATYSPNLKVNL